MLAKLRYDPANTDDDAFATALTGAGPFTTFLISGAMPDGLAHQLVVTADADITDTVLTVTGTDADDNAITDALTIADTTPVESVKYFKTIVSIAASVSLGSDHIKVGFVDEFVGPTIALDWSRNVPSHFFLDVTGTISLDVDFAIADPGLFAEQSLVPWKVVSASLDDEASDSSAFVDIGAGYTAFRVRVNSYTNTAEFTLYASQPEVV